jgi:DNA-binding transcriptional ArsR family regulator
VKTPRRCFDGPPASSPSPHDAAVIRIAGAILADSRHLTAQRRLPHLAAGGLHLRLVDGWGLTSASVSRTFPFVTTYGRHEGWEALGDPSRFTIVRCLAERPRAVGELADELPISRPAVSQHLKVLKSAGLVTDRAVGTRRVYRLNPAGVAALRDQLDTFWNRALDGYQGVVEDKTQESS